MKNYDICFMRFNGELHHCIVSGEIHNFKRKYFVPTSFDFVMSLVNAGYDQEWLLSNLSALENHGHLWIIPANGLM